MNLGSKLVSLDPGSQPIPVTVWSWQTQLLSQSPKPGYRPTPMAPSFKLTPGPGQVPWPRLPAHLTPGPVSVRFRCQAHLCGAQGLVGPMNHDSSQPTQIQVPGPLQQIKCQAHPHGPKHQARPCVHKQEDCPLADSGTTLAYLRISAASSPSDTTLRPTQNLWTG